MEICIRMEMFLRDNHRTAENKKWVGGDRTMYVTQTKKII